VATLKEIAAATTVIVASHGRALIEAADTVVAIRDGRLLAARREPPAEPLQVVR
jgi:ABC-type transport system involved in cytochrome bd biosynthesis fused ATPase/permease subunit